MTKQTKQGVEWIEKMQLEAAFFGSPWIGGNFWAAVRLELSGPRAFGPVADSTWQPGSLLVGNTFDREKYF